MKFLRALIKSIVNFPGWFARTKWNKFITVMALPGLFVAYLALVFLGGLTGISDYLPYRKVKDNDRSYKAAQETDVLYLSQGWQDRYRNRYYFTPQGSHILPLDLALALEMPESNSRIFGPSGTAVKQFGYLPYRSEALKTNMASKFDLQTPYQVFKDNPALKDIKLPVGFTVDGSPKEPMLGVNCAACHTSNIRHNGKTIRIEGGAAMGDFIGLFNAIDDSLLATLNEPSKEERLAKRLFDDPTPKDRAKLRERLLAASAQRQAWQRRNSDLIPAEVPHGHGRVDAFGVIFNQVLGRDLHQDRLAPPDEIVDNKAATKDMEQEAGRYGNVRSPDAPVSYPVLWDTPFMGRVQWNGSANNVSQGGVLGRNTGQVLGVFGDIDVTQHNNLPGYCSTVKRKNLQRFDYWIRSLKSPQWEEAAAMDALPLIDPVKRDLGYNIYHGLESYAGRVKLGDHTAANNCASCHSVPKPSYRDKPQYKKKTCELELTMVQADMIKTDQNTAKAGIRSGAYAGPLAGQPLKKTPTETVPVQSPKITLLREVVAGSIAGSFQPLTCEGNAKPGALIEAANGFGKIARGRIFAKHKTKNGGMYQDKKIGGGFELEGSYGEDKQNVERIDECSNAKIIRNLTQADKDAGISGADPFALSYSADAYRARPLTGIWASAPYLHNGSIPSLYDLLTPPLGLDSNCSDPENNCRPATFHVGSINFNPERVGFESEAGDHSTLIDTRLQGNLNSGHSFMTDLSHEERMALIEYLKTL